MTDLQGALGCVQMDRADELLDQRRRLAGLTAAVIEVVVPFSALRSGAQAR